MKKLYKNTYSYLYWFKNLLSMIYSKVLIYFGKKYDSSFIPEGMYCYKLDDEKNKNKKHDDYHIYLIPCRYYKTLGKHWNGCKYLGIITDDDVFDDQCKMCSENFGDDDDYDYGN